MRKKISLKTSTAQTGVNTVHTCVRAYTCLSTHTYAYTVWFCVGKACIGEVRTSCMEGMTPEHILKAFSKCGGKVSLQVESDGVLG